MTDGGWGQPGAVAAPGWYPDPDGVPGLVRWWNGGTWSDVTTPAGPGVTVGAPFQVPAELPGPPSAPPPAAAPARPARSRRAPLLIGAGVLLLVLVLVVVGALAGGSSTQHDAASVAAPTSEPGTVFPPGTVRIVDQAAGISYPFLGDGWYEFDLGGQLETSATAGQYFVTQATLPDSPDEFIAQCTSGPLADGFGWAGAGSLASTTRSLGDFVGARHYPAPNDRRVLRDEATTVDGAAAWVYEFDLTWHVAGYDSTGERAALLLIDVGRPAPALLYVSIPNTHAELYGVIDRVLGDVDVL